MTPWLAILGIGEAGVETLTADAVRRLRTARLVVGGARHLRLAAALIEGETLAWQRPIADTLAPIAARRGEPVAVLCSGDPFHHGAGAMLAAAFDAAEWVAIPAVSSVSLAASALGWPLEETTVVSLCGRPLATLVGHLQPGARVLVLSEGADTPIAVAATLCDLGAGHSRVTVLERLGGPGERRTSASARDLAGPFDPLNIVAVAVSRDVAALPIAPGLDDACFAHDGQLTRAELRAAALAALAPRRGELLWDVGAGAGSVAIEWRRLHPLMRALAFERDAARAARIGANAAALGAPGIVVVPGEAPESFAGQPRPDAAFIGGGGRPETIEAAWAALRPGGRLVAHSVTVETEEALFDANARLGGAMTRIAIERLDTIGRYRAFRPEMTVTQWSVVKS